MHANGLRKGLGTNSNQAVVVSNRLKSCNERDVSNLCMTAMMTQGESENMSLLFKSVRIE